MEISIKLLDIIFSGLKYALDAKHEFVTPEHLLKAALDSEEVKQLIDECNGNLQDIQKNTESYLSKNVFALENVEPVPTLGFQSLLEQTVLHSIAVERKYICLRDFIVSLYDAEKIQAGFILKKAGISRLSLLDSVDILTDDFFIPVDEIPAKEFPYIKEAFTVPPFIEELMKNLADEENSEVLEEFSKEIDTSDESKLQSFLQFLDNSEEQDEKKQKKNKDSKKKFLDHFTKDLIQACQKGEVDPILYRDNEINQTFEILLRRVKNNALHVGDAGVGKTAILMGIAEAIFTGKCPDFFKDFSVYSLDIGALIAGTRYRGDFEERFKKLIEELSQKEKVILVIDEIHTIVGAGNGQEGLDIANLLKPILSEGKIRIVGSTTFEDYKKTIAKNNALARRFQKIDIEEPSVSQTVKILEGLKNVGISENYILSKLTETPTSLILFDDEGKRKIYCDLKDIQETEYPMENARETIKTADLVVACNCNFNRPLLKMAKDMGKIIATDVHVLSDLKDDYNREFMQYADIVFLSDEIIISDNKNPWEFLKAMYEMYMPKVIVLGRGSKGALMYLGEKDEFVELAAVRTNEVVNTVGAGDALFSAFVHFYAKGMEVVECLRRAQIFASLKIAYNGASLGFASEEEIERWYKEIYGW